MIQYIYVVLGQTNADMIFGGITIVCGILGTLGGGFILDYMDATIPNAFKVTEPIFQYIFVILFGYRIIIFLLCSFFLQQLSLVQYFALVPSVSRTCTFSYLSLQ